MELNTKSAAAGVQPFSGRTGRQLRSEEEKGKVEEEL